MKSIVQSSLMLVMLTLIFGVVYPAVMTGLGQLFWTDRCNGSLVKRDQVVIGSELIAQKFARPEYFWPRPSASDYNAVPSSASNLGPTSEALQKLIKTRKESLLPSLSEDDVPMDLLTASGSGLDPHILPATAKLQVKRIVTARNLDENGFALVNDLIDKLVEPRQFGILGEDRVNVLSLNLALDRCCSKGQQ
ncbi:MAG TPA: potassium-transporting ATPase subunit KdpC [Myxococcota bacterium]|nr:potassium-transporting ATPase subunit KdpC [Myxococcota bacterium]